MADESPEQDSEIRRRAAWLLGMLALVAALFVALMVTFFNTSGGDDNTDNLAGPSDPGVPSSSTSAAPRSSGSTPSGSSGSPSGTPTGTSGSATGPAAGGTASCPGSDPCALDNDIGNAVAAINAYRTENGKKAVPAAVSAEAKKCALSNGSDCSGGWAETQVPAQDGKADGKAAVAKIQEFGKLLSDMKSIAVGWAYDPGAEQFYFAIVRSE